MIIALLGGIGLFLLGMGLLTDGLKSLAGDALRRMLQRLTGRTLSGLATGAVVTAAIQSSSATTLMTIGFVSAGLMSFPQSLGVILGANIGTTSTGWIVSMLGLKISLGSVAPAIVFIGAAMRLLGRGRVASVGLSLAGFGLIFLGIGALQDGMGDLAERIDPAQMPGDGLSGRLLLVLVGIVMTVLMQSSSAAIAATLVAVHAGAIDFPQAAALVVGQNIGTSVTAIVAAIGGSIPSRRTALAHVMFNVVTGAVALLALPAFVRLAESVATGFEGDPGPATIAAFHTLFNLVGVALFLPFTGPLARAIIRIVPDRGPRLTRHLDPSVAAIGAVGLDAARTAVVGALAQLLAILDHRGDGPAPSSNRGSVVEVEAAIVRIREFLARLSSSAQSDDEVARHLGLIHAADHLAQLAGAAREVDVRIEALDAAGDAEPSGLLGIARTALGQALDWSRAQGESAATGRPPVAPAVSHASVEMATRRREVRQHVLLEIARGRVSAADGFDAIEAMRWLDRVLYHVARALHHLSGTPGADDAVRPATVPDAASSGTEPVATSDPQVAEGGPSSTTGRAPGVDPPAPH